MQLTTTIQIIVVLTARPNQKRKLQFIIVKFTTLLLTNIPIPIVNISIINGLSISIYESPTIFLALYLAKKNICSYSNDEKYLECNKIFKS